MRRAMASTSLLSCEPPRALLRMSMIFYYQLMGACNCSEHHSRELSQTADLSYPVETIKRITIQEETPKFPSDFPTQEFGSPSYTLEAPPTKDETNDRQIEEAQTIASPEQNIIQAPVVVYEEIKLAELVERIESQIAEQSNSNFEPKSNEVSLQFAPPPVKTERQLLMDALYHEYKELFLHAHSIPVVDTQKKKHQVIKAREIKFHGEHIQFLLEREDHGIVPEQFMRLFYKVVDFYCFNQKRVAKYDVVKVEQAVDGSEIETYANIGLKMPMVAARINFDTKYFFKEENLFIMSEMIYLAFDSVSGRGNHKIQEDYYAAHDCKKFALGHTILSCLRFDPIHDHTGKVTGTKSHFMSIADYGSIPKWILKSMAPKGFTEFYDDYADAARKVVV